MPAPRLQGCRRDDRSARSDPLVPGPDPDAAALLGGAGLRDPAALRHGGGRRHVPPGDDAARARPEALERRLRAALAPAQGRPLRREPQPPAALLPVPGDPEAVARRTCRSSTCARSPRSASIRALHDIRFVEDDWESPTLGAWGLGWECWCDGMEVSQFTYFQQVAGFECTPVSGETHLRPRAPRHVCAGRRERLRPQLQRPRRRRQGHLWRRVPAERAGVFALQFRGRRHRHAVPPLRATPRPSAGRCSRRASAAERPPRLALPAYDQCIKASHVFNLLDARGVISVTERQSYILRVRELAKACGAAWLKTEAGGFGRHSS